ncbi:MAG: hypothetical protein KJZ84_16670 [Bryobacteraceae bacterium]|nr:hypothetical protein [Bryobacteraceae bacterium]
MLTRRACLALAAAGAARASGEARWQPVLTLDEPGYDFRLAAACFPAPRTGFAAGFSRRHIDFGEDNLLFHTEDAGKTWVRKNAPGRPLDAFTLGESHVWLLGPNRLWFASDGGWQWRSLSGPKNATSIHFVDHLRGFACAGRRVYQTSDAGNRWTVVPAAEAPLFPRELNWNLIRFRDRAHGLIAGSADLPLALDAKGPDGEPLTGRQRGRLRIPALALLRTSDGGASWAPGVAPAPGNLASLLDDGETLTAAFLGDKLTRYPGTVARAPAAGRPWRTLLREESVAVHSLALHEGELHAAGTHGDRIVVMAEDRYGEWRLRPVHYAAQGSGARFFSGPRGEPWILIPGGMILAPVG